MLDKGGRKRCTKDISRTLKAQLLRKLLVMLEGRYQVAGY